MFQIALKETKIKEQASVVVTAFLLLPDGRPSPSPFFPPFRLCEPAADDTASTTDRAERGRVELFFKGAEDKPTDRVHRRAANVTAKAVERRRRDESQGELGETAAHCLIGKGPFPPLAVAVHISRSEQFWVWRTSMYHS